MFRQDQETEDLLNDQEIDHFIDSKRGANREQRLRNWVIYWKKRGKSRACNQQEHEEEQDYSKDLEEVGRFCSLKQFFGFYTSIKEPSSIEKDIKLFYFLSDCRPLWEDWPDTGCLLITVKFKDDKDQTGAHILNSTWEFLLFGLIGNNLPRARMNKELTQHEREANREHPKYQQEGKELIIGLILQRREKISLIEVWYRNELHAAQLTRLLKEDIQKHLNLKPEDKSAINIKYKRHKDSLQTNSTLKGGFNLKPIHFGSTTASSCE